MNTSQVIAFSLGAEPLVFLLVCSPVLNSSK